MQATGHACLLPCAAHPATVRHKLPLRQLSSLSRPALSSNHYTQVASDALLSFAFPKVMVPRLSQASALVPYQNIRAEHTEDRNVNRVDAGSTFDRVALFSKYTISIERNVYKIDNISLMEHAVRCVQLT